MEEISKTSTWLTEWITAKLQLLNLPEAGETFLKIIILAFVLGLLAWLSYLLVRTVFMQLVVPIISRSKSKMDDFLVQRKVFHRLSHLAPGIVLYSAIPWFFSEHPDLLTALKKLAILYLIFATISSLRSFMQALEDIYGTFPFAHERPIKGYLQVFHLIFIIMGVLFSVSVLFNTDLLAIFAGLGAIAAVLLLIFKDTILGLVAGVQLSANHMVHVGDWITMPSHNADGDVLEITLNTVKVQNWDKTISTIPTYALVSNSFINWRGMQESGGRRIKRSISIDMQSVKFCTPEMLERFRKIQHLKSYIDQRQKEIEAYNISHKIDESVLVNGRRMTNLGVFRKYLQNYLLNHPKTNKEMTMLVRHLQPGDKGIPIEIYVFSSDQVWANYESIQADIFDHVLAVIPQFDLQVFQAPSGNDFRALAK